MSNFERSIRRKNEKREKNIADDMLKENASSKSMVLEMNSEIDSLNYKISQQISIITQLKDSVVDENIKNSMDRYLTLFLELESGLNNISKYPIKDNYTDDDSMEISYRYLELTKILESYINIMDNFTGNMASLIDRNLGITDNREESMNAKA